MLLDHFLYHSSSTVTCTVHLQMLCSDRYIRRPLFKKGVRFELSSQIIKRILTGLDHWMKGNYLKKTMKDWMVQHLEAICAVFIAFMDHLWTINAFPKATSEFLVFLFHRFIVFFSTTNSRTQITVPS